MTGEAKRAKITGKEETIIADYATLFRDMHRTPLAEKILSEVNWPGKPPEVEVLERKISNARAHKPLPLDKPWHLGLLREYPHLSAEAVRHIDEVQQAMRSFFENVPVNPDSYHITIRQALWVARLYDIVRKHVENDEPRERFKNTAPDDPHVLLSVTFSYARYELLCDLLKKISCDTSELDAALSHGLQQFYDFVGKQQTQALREGDIIPAHKVYEEHKNPHKMNEDWNFVFDPNCQACRDREVNGKWHELDMRIWERQQAKLSRNDRKEKSKKEAQNERTHTAKRQP